MSRMRMLFVDDAVIELCKFCFVPTFCCTYKVTGDALQLVDVLAAATRTFEQLFLCVFVSAIHATVAVVVHRAVAYVVLVHEVYDVHYGLRIVCCIAVNLYVEDVSATCEIVVGSLYFGLVLW